MKLEPAWTKECITVTVFEEPAFWSGGDSSLDSPLGL